MYIINKYSPINVTQIIKINLMDILILIFKTNKTNTGNPHSLLQIINNEL